MLCWAHTKWSLWLSAKLLVQVNFDTAVFIVKVIEIAGKGPQIDWNYGDIYKIPVIGL